MSRTMPQGKRWEFASFPPNPEQRRP
jgi:hypothetical protein